MKYKPNLRNDDVCCRYWHWRRAVSLIVLITFSSSLFTSVFASYQPTINEVDPIAKAHKEKQNRQNEAGRHKSISTPIKFKGNNNETGAIFFSPQIDSLENKLFSSQNKYQPYFELGGAKYFNQNSSAAGIYDLFLPLLQKDDQLFFADLRIFDRSGNSSEGNLHLGYRKLYPKTRQMFGVYGAFDCKRSEKGNSFKQLTLGLEYWHDKWFVGGNVYKPIGITKKLIEKAPSQERITSGRNIAEIETENKYYDKVLPGIDAELGYAITENLTSYVGGYYFTASDANTVAGPKIRVTYDYLKPNGRILGILDGISIEAGVQHDKPRGTSAYIGLKLKVGLTNFEKSSNKNSNISGFARHMVELVRRDPDIVTVKTKETNQNKKFYQTKVDSFQEGAKPETGEDGFQEGAKPEKSKDLSQWTTEELLKELGLEGVTDKETSRKIRKRYHELALKHHPDKGGNDEDFARINNIYEILSQRFSSKEKNTNQSRTPTTTSTNSLLALSEARTSQIESQEDNGNKKYKEYKYEEHKEHKGNKRFKEYKYEENKENQENQKENPATAVVMVVPGNFSGGELKNNGSNENSLRQKNWVKQERRGSGLDEPANESANKSLATSNRIMIKRKSEQKAIGCCIGDDYQQKAEGRFDDNKISQNIKASGSETKISSEPKPEVANEGGSNKSTAFVIRTEDLPIEKHEGVNVKKETSENLPVLLKEFGLPENVTQQDAKAKQQEYELKYYSDKTEKNKDGEQALIRYNGLYGGTKDVSSEASGSGNQYKQNQIDLLRYLKHTSGTPATFLIPMSKAKTGNDNRSIIPIIEAQDISIDTSTIDTYQTNNTAVTKYTPSLFINRNFLGSDYGLLQRYQIESTNEICGKANAVVCYGVVVEGRDQLRENTSLLGTSVFKSVEITTARAVGDGTVQKVFPIAAENEQNSLAINPGSFFDLDTCLICKEPRGGLWRLASCNGEDEENGSNWLCYQLKIAIDTTISEDLGLKSYLVNNGGVGLRGPPDNADVQSLIADDVAFSILDTNSVCNGSWVHAHEKSTLRSAPAAYPQNDIPIPETGMLLRVSSNISQFNYTQSFALSKTEQIKPAIEADRNNILSIAIDLEMAILKGLKWLGCAIDHFFGGFQIIPGAHALEITSQIEQDLDNPSVVLNTLLSEQSAENKKEPYGIEELMNILAPEPKLKSEQQQIVNKIYTIDDLISVLNTIDSASRELTEDQTNVLERVIKDGSAYNIQVHKLIARILTNYVTHSVTGSSHVVFLVDLAKNENIESEIAETIINKFANDVISAKAWRDNKVFDSFASLLSKDTSSCALARALIYANSELHGYVANIESLQYFEKLLDADDAVIRKSASMLVADSLEELLLSYDSNTNLSAIERCINNLQDKIGKLPSTLVDKIFEAYKKDSRYFTRLIVDRLAEDKFLDPALLKNIIGTISKIEPKAALFIAVRLVQHYVALPNELLKYLVKFLYVEEEALRLSAFALFNYLILANKVPVEINTILVDALIALLPKVGEALQTNIKKYLNKEDLSREQITNYQLQQQIIGYRSINTVKEKSKLNSWFANKIDVKAAGVLIPFFNETLFSQNSISIDGVKGLFDTANQEAIFVLNGINAELSAQSRKNTFDIIIGSNKFLLTREQWQNWIEPLEDIKTKEVLDEINFSDFREVERFLKFIKDNGWLSEKRVAGLLIAANFIKPNGILTILAEDALIKDRFDQILYQQEHVLNSNEVYSNLLWDLVVNITAQYPELLPLRSDQNELILSIKNLEKTQWPLDLLFSVIRKAFINDINNNTHNIATIVYALAMLADYGIAPEIVNRYGITAATILKDNPTTEIPAAIKKLIEDNSFFVSMDLESLLKELIRLNPGNKAIEYLVKNAPEQIAEIERIRKNWPGLRGITKPLAEWTKAEDFIKWYKAIGVINDSNILEIIAVISQAVFNAYSYYPRKVQLLALLSLLNSPRGGLAQIETGEGKSIIISMLAAIKAMQGRQIDIVTSSSELAIIAATDAKNIDFYSHIGVEIAHNIDDENYHGGKKECYLKPVIYGTYLEFIGDTLRDITDDVKLGRGFDLVIVDEVDSMFIDGNSGKVQLTYTIRPGFNNLAQLLTYMWGKVTEILPILHQGEGQCYLKKPLLNDEQAAELQKGAENFDPKIFESSKYDFELSPIEGAFSCKEVLKDYAKNYTTETLFDFKQPEKEKRSVVVPSYLEQFVTDQLDSWVESIFSSYTHKEKVDYVIATPNDSSKGDMLLNDKPTKEIMVVDFKNTGTILHNLHWGDGLHQFLQIKHGLVVHPENIITTFMSNFGFFNKYKGNIYGVTGTLGDTIHHEFLIREYGVELSIVPPFVRKNLKKFPPFLVDLEEEWRQAVVNDINQNSRRSRPTLVILETMEDVEALYVDLTTPKTETGYPGYEFQITKYGYGDEKSDKEVVKQVLAPKDVIIATNLAGRGTDLELNKEAVKNGGLHVILGVYSESERVELQAFGRGARKGTPGSVRLIINRERLKTNCFKEDIFGCLEEERKINEARKFKIDSLLQLPLIKIRDEVFELFVELIKEDDSSTQYKLFIGNPKKAEIKQHALYLYKKDNQIWLKLVSEKAEEDLDITELVRDIDPQAGIHIRSVLSNHTNNLSSLNRQSYEIVNFIAARKGYTQLPVIYERVQRAFKDRVHEFLNTDKEIKKEYLLWLADRELYNREHEIEQITEDWGIWLKKEERILSQYESNQCALVYIETEQLQQEKLNKIREQLKEDFFKFKEGVAERINANALIQNPAYLIKKAWDYRNIYIDQWMLGYSYDENSNSNDTGWFSFFRRGVNAIKSFFGGSNYKPIKPLECALNFANEAINLDKIRSWAAHNAKSFFIIDNASKHIKKEEQAEEAFNAKREFCQEQRLYARAINEVNIPELEAQIAFLTVKNMASFDDDIIKQLMGEIKVWQKLAEQAEKNINVAISISEKEMIKPDFIDIVELINDVDVPDKQLILSSLVLSGGHAFEVKSYKLQEEDKDWFGTIFAAVIGVASIFTGLWMINAFSGSVFASIFGGSLAMQGIGDVISSLVSVGLGKPVEFNDFIKSKGISIGISLATAGVLHFLDKIKIIHDTQVISNAAKNIAKAAKSPLEFIGKSAATQISTAAATTILFNLGKNLIDIKDIKAEAGKHIDNIIEKCKKLLNRIFLTDDKFNGNNKLENELEDESRKLISHYQGRFDDLATSVGVDIGTGVLATSFGGVANYLKPGLQATMRAIDNRQILNEMAGGFERVIQEIGARALTISDMMEKKMAEKFHPTTSNTFITILEAAEYLSSDGSFININNKEECSKINALDLGAALLTYVKKEVASCEEKLKTEGYTGDASVTCVKVVNDSLADYKKGIIEACEYVQNLLTSEYPNKIATFKERAVELISNLKVSLQKDGIHSLANIPGSIIGQEIGERSWNFIKDKVIEGNIPRRERINVEKIAKETGFAAEDKKPEDKSSKRNCAEDGTCGKDKSGEQKTDTKTNSRGKPGDNEPLSTNQKEWIKQYDNLAIWELNDNAKQKGSPYEIVVNPEQVEGTELGYIVKRSLNQPEFLRKDPYEPTVGLDRTIATHEGLWFPWVEGDPSKPGASILSYSGDNLIKYAGSGSDNNLIDNTFKYRGVSDRKEYYFKENIAGLPFLGSPVGDVDVAFDAHRMYEAVKSAKSDWESKPYSIPSHNCRDFVQQAAMKTYLENGGKIYLIPTKNREEKLGV